MSNKKITLEIVIDGKNQVKSVTQDLNKLHHETKAAGVEAANLDKNLKGAGNISKNTTSNFAKQAQGMGGLVHVYATVAANVFALSAAYEVLKQNSDLSIMEKAANDLATTTGISYSAVANSMKEITGGAISFQEAMRQANLGLSGGATAQQLETITEIANKAANTLGRSVPESVGRMIQAVTKGEPELVDELGIILRVTKATQDYADAHKKTATTLTTFEKQQAIINQLITQGTQKFADVEKAVNPYARLSASLSELAINLVKVVSIPVTGIAEIFSKNTALMSAGIGLLIASIGKKAIPILGTMGEEAQQILKRTSEEAEAASMRAIEKMDILTKRKKELAVLERIRPSQPGMTGKQAGIDLRELIQKDIMPKLNKNGEISKSLAKMMASGITGEELTKQFRKQKIAFKLSSALKKEINKVGSSGEFDKSELSKKAAISTLKGEIVEASILQKKSLEKETVAMGIKKASVEALVAEQEKLTFSARSIAAQGRVSILNATTLKGAYKELRTSLSLVAKSYVRAGIDASLYTKASLVVESVTKRVALVTVFLTKAMESAFSAISKMTLVLFIFETISTGIEALGLLNKEFNNNSAAIQDTVEELDKAIDRYKEINKDIKAIPKSLEEASTKWTKISGVAHQYADAISKIIKESDKLNKLSVFDYIRHPINAFMEPKKAAEGIKKAMRELNRITGKPVNLPIHYIYKDPKQAYFIKKLIDPKYSAERTITFTSFMNTDAIEKALGDNNVLKALAKQYPELAKALLDPIDRLKSAEKTIKGLIIGNDKRLSDLNNKSDSRRILNTDTLIGFRDDLKTLQIELSSFSKSSLKEAKDSIKPFLDSVPKAYRKAFLSMLKDTDTPILAVKKLKKELKGLDKQINTVRNFDVNKSILGEKIKKVQENKQKGDLSAISEEYRLQTKDLKLQLTHLEAQYGVTDKLKELIAKDSTHNKLILQLILAQEEALKRKIALRTVAVGSLLGAVEAQRRSMAIDKARLNLQNQALANNKSQIALASNLSQDSAKVVALLQEQSRLSQSISDKKVKELEDTKIKEKLDNTILDLTGNLVIKKEAQLKIDLLTAKQQGIRLKQAKEELDVQKAIFDANNASRGNIGNTGYVGGFNGLLGDNHFWTNVGTKFAIIADDMGKTLGNSVDNIAKVSLDAIDNVTSNLVSSIISNKWDGKKEGRSMAVALREGLKDTLRKSIGSVIADNMKQAIVKFASTLFDSEVKRDATVADQIAATNLLIGALDRNTASQVGGSVGSADSIISSVLGTVSDGSGTPGKPGTVGNYKPLFDSSNSHFATGGIVHRPTNALIGEGKNSEAVVPLPDNRSIPVRLEGNTQPNININNTYDFSGADPSSEARLRQYADQIKQDTIREIVDNINRGGTMAKTVGRRR